MISKKFWIIGAICVGLLGVYCMSDESSLVATATNRRRMFKHAKAPEGVAERAQEQVDLWRAEEEAAKAVAAEDAQGKFGDAEGRA